MQSLFKRKFFLILKRFFALPRRSPPKADEGWALPRRSPKGAKAGVLIAILAITAVVFLVPSVVRAEPPGNMGAISGGMMQWLSTLALGLGEFFIKMSIFFLRFFIALAQYNNYIDSPVVKLGWLMVRDVVNMFFVVILLVIAIGTILGIEQYQWNKTLVKMILSAVFVNFSNLICQLFIDAAHIFTLTFASAISATAGGNLINMFHFEKIYAIVTGKNDIGQGGSSFDMLGRTLIASIVAMLFALLAMLIMGAYAIMMLLRMTVLWVLIILSPMAFLFIALPQTQNRYAEWWKEFSNYVVLGPTIAFFMWLAFATAGSGTLGTDLGITDDMLQAGSIDSVGALTLSAVTTWENMANFLVAIVLLFVGLQEVQKLNVAGGSVASKAKDFFGKVATIATGYAAGRWLVGATGKMTGGAVKGALWHMPLGGETLSENAKLAWERTKTAWYVGAGAKGELMKEDKIGRAMRKAFGWNIGRLAGRTARRKKHLRAAEKTTEAAEELISKQQSSGQWGNRARNIRGRLEAYEERSKHRDAEGVAEAKEKELMAPRYKDGRAYINPDTGEVSTLAGEAARFLVREQKWEESEKGLLAEERKKIIDRAKPDMEKAAAETEEAKNERKSDALREVEETERQAGAMLHDAEKRIQAEIEIKLKADPEMPGLRSNLDTSRERVGVLDKELAEKRKNADYAELVEDTREKKKFEEALEKIEDQLTDPEAVLSDVERTKLEKTRTSAEEKIARLKEKIDGNIVGREKEAEIRGVENARQEAKKSVEDFEDKIKDKRKAIAKDLEDKTRVAPDAPDSPTVTEQREVLKKAQDETKNATKAWEKIVEAAAQKPKPTFATKKEEEEWQRRLEFVGPMRDEERNELEIDRQRERDAQAKERLKKIEADLLDGDLTDGKGNIIRENDGKAVKRKNSNIAIAYFKALQKAATAGAGVEAAEGEARKIALGLDSYNRLFSLEVASKMGAESAKSFIDGIKDKKMGDLFKKGAEELKRKIEEGLAEGIKPSLETLKLQSVGARMAQAQMVAEFNKDITAASKTEAVDQATDVFTMERYNFKTPASSFKDWVKKQTEHLQGVEREQSVINAMGTLGQFFRLQKEGKEISIDQQAQMMAHLKHLTSNGWMDDLLGGIARTAVSKDSFTGEQRDEAEALHKIFIEQLKWDPDDNRSGADRTAQVQKLIAVKGDVKQMQAEEASLWRMERKNESYVEANKRMAEIAYNNHGKIVGAGANEESRRQVAKEAGIITQGQIDSYDTDKKAKAAVDAGINQLVAYTEKFVAPAGKMVKSAEEAAGTFIKSMDQFTEAFEMLADFKNLAMTTGHIDDGGHTYYDMDARMVRGNLGHVGKAFVLGEWRKLGLDQRLSRLKTHSVGQMHEDYGTIDYTAGEECDDAIRETFAGLSSQREFAKADGRNKDHIAGMAAGESIRYDDNNMAKIGDNDSVYFRGTFKHEKDLKKRRKLVEDRIRGNYAAFLRNSPAALFGSLAERSGLSFDDGMNGNINVNVCDTPMRNVEDLVAWVNQDPAYRFKSEQIRRALAGTKKTKKGEYE